MCNFTPLFTIFIGLLVTVSESRMLVEPEPGHGPTIPDPNMVNNTIGAENGKVNKNSVYPFFLVSLSVLLIFISKYSYLKNIKGLILIYFLSVSY